MPWRLVAEMLHAVVKNPEPKLNIKLLQNMSAQVSTAAPPRGIQHFWVSILAEPCMPETRVNV